MSYIYIYMKWNIIQPLKGNTDTCYCMDEAWGYYAKWNKWLTKSQILYDSTYVRYLEYKFTETKK